MHQQTNQPIQLTDYQDSQNFNTPTRQQRRQQQQQQNNNNNNNNNSHVLPIYNFIPV